jgi:hypothetical protein
MTSAPDARRITQEGVVELNDLRLVGGDLLKLAAFSGCASSGEAASVLHLAEVRTEISVCRPLQ